MAEVDDEPSDDLKAIFWAGFLRFAWSDPDARAAFTADTGVTIPPTATSPIEQLVDDACTGGMETIAAQFVRWATVNHYGLEYAPQSYRDFIERNPT